MLIVTSSEKKKCVCCKTVSVNEYLSYEHCGIEVRIPLCNECQKTATFLLIRQLKPLCNSISKAVTMSHMLGNDERKLAEIRQKIQQFEGEQE